MASATANTSSETSSPPQDSYNPNDPLFLHHEENPSAIFSTFDWRWELLRKSLISKNKLGFIDGSLTISSPLVDLPSAIQAWIQANNMVGTWIINSVSPKIQASIIYREIVLEIWTNLKDTFCQRNGPKVFNLQKHIGKLHQGEQSITNYFTQLCYRISYRISVPFLCVHVESVSVASIKDLQIFKQRR